MGELIELQSTMFLLIMAGLILRKTGVLGAEAKNVMTSLVLNLILPCNILKSYMVEFSWDIARNFAAILVISILVQIFCIILGRILFGNYPGNRGKCLMYGTICSNAGFLGSPIAEGVFGSFGLALASVYLIPQRIVMWSAGVAIFTDAPDWRKLVRKVITHPCIITSVGGLIFLITGFIPPGWIMAPLTALSSCNTACSMLVIGMILAEADPRQLVDKDLLYFSLWRLLLIPLILWIPCHFMGLDPLVTGVSVLLAAMPAGATTSMLATQFHGDEIFAVKLVVYSTLLSLITTPLWSIFLR